MKKNWNVAKIFTLLITVLFLASTLFVGCKEQEPEPGPEPSPVMYTVTYAVEGGGNSVTGIPEPKTVEKGTVLKVDDLPTLTEPEGWSFEGWYIGEEPFTSDYTVTSNIIITAKFVENVAPSLPEDPVDPDTTNNFNGNYYAGEDDMGYIEFTTETDCVVFVVSAVPAKYTVADNVATIKGVKVSNEEDYSAIEIKTTALANDSFSVTYPVEICQRFDPDASEDMVITYTKTDKPSSEGGEGDTTPPADGEEDSTTPDTTNNFNGNYYAGKDGDTDFGYIEFTTETECVVYVVSEVPATYTVADNVATIKGEKISDEEDYSAIEIKTTTLANDSFSITYPVEICQKFDPAASENMVITYTKANKPSSEGGEGGVIPEPEPTVPTKYMVSYETNLEGLQVENIPTKGEVEENKTIELPTLTLEGYTFDGWYDGDTKVESPYKVTKAVTLTAKFTKIVPVPTEYMVTYETNPEGLQVENFPTNGEVEENKTIELPSLTLEGYTFNGWYDGETEVESPYKVTKAVTLTAKFTEIVPDTTNNFNGNYYAGKYGDTDFGYIEFTNEIDCVVSVESEVYATYTVADNVATIKGVRISDEEDYSAIEIKTTTLANDSFSVTYPVEICKIFNPSASEDMFITYTKVDNPSSGGGGAVVVPDPVETFLVTYTVVGIDANLVTGLPETGNVNKDTVLSLSPLEAPEGYVFDGWFINDELVSQHTVDADVTIVAKFSAIVPVGTTYTIPDINAEWTNIVVYAWSEDVDAVILQATNDAGIVSFQSTVEYEKAIVVKINDSVDTNNVVIDEDSELHVWSADVKVDQTGNLELGENNIYEVPVVSKYTIYLSPGEKWPEAGAWFIAWTYGGEKTADEWIKFTDLDEDGIYEAEIYEDKTTMILLRKDPSVTSIDWNGEWARIETSIGGNCFTIVGWDDSNSWSTYTPE